jgi:hypothetical protein
MNNNIKAFAVASTVAIAVGGALFVMIAIITLPMNVLFSGVMFAVGIGTVVFGVVNAIIDYRK